MIWQGIFMALKASVLYIGILFLEASLAATDIFLLTAYFLFV